MDKKFNARTQLNQWIYRFITRRNLFRNYRISLSQLQQPLTSRHYNSTCHRTSDSYLYAIRDLIYDFPWVDALWLILQEKNVKKNNKINDLMCRTTLHVSWHKFAIFILTTCVLNNLRSSLSLALELGKRERERSTKDFAAPVVQQVSVQSAFLFHVYVCVAMEKK